MRTWTLFRARHTNDQGIERIVLSLVQSNEASTILLLLKDVKTRRVTARILGNVRCQWAAEPSRQVLRNREISVPDRLEAARALGSLRARVAAEDVVAFVDQVSVSSVQCDELVDIAHAILNLDDIPFLLEALDRRNYDREEFFRFLTYAELVFQIINRLDTDWNKLDVAKHFITRGC